MPIKASAARQIETHIANLGSDSADVREAAVARLTLIGPRAVDRLLLLLDSPAPAGARIAALGVLEAIADPRALDPVLDALDTPDPDVACAAAAAARVFVRGIRGVAAVDRLTRTALDAGRDEEVRIAALRALGDLDRATVAPLLDTLRRDSSDRIRTATLPASSVDPGELIERAAERGLPDDPADLADALSRGGASAALPLLLRVIERMREREAEQPGARQVDWSRVRGRAHVVLAERGSRIALYDLRESIEGASSPLPVEFLAALSAGGDSSCLEAIAAAYARAAAARSTKDSDQGWWRDHLADAFRTIVKRERLTPRHAGMQKIRKRWPEILRRP